MTSPSPVRHLLCIHDKDGIRTICLSLQHYAIGRDQQNDIVLFSKTVSRYHARLTRISGNSAREDHYRIIDGDAEGKMSTNGIMINDNKSYAQDLNHGDRIIIGKVKLTYHTQQVGDSERRGIKAAFQSVQDLEATINPKATISMQDFPVEPLFQNEPEHGEDPEDLPPTNFFT